MANNVSKVVEDKPFVNFANNQGTIMYFHQFIIQFPEILANAVGKLSVDLFLESIRNIPKKQGKEVTIPNSLYKNASAMELKVFNSDQAIHTKSISGALLVKSNQSLSIELD